MAGDFEKLGAFYLGRSFDLKTDQPGTEPLLYDSRDLTTHAVIVGMTGSGKTGLGISLIEEAALDGIPSLVIDPKGDMANLLLTFPGLSPQEFRPWINEDDARRKGLEPDAYAAQQAATWKKGLAGWGEGPERIQKLRDSAEFKIYTPGSESGTPVSILASFAAPSRELLDDSDLMRARVATTATSLLGLLGIDADPVRSREHILLSQLFDRFWRDGKSLDLGQLIGAIQKPPIQRVGVLELEAFYPSQERFELAMKLNNLLASPSFQSWIEGEPLDVGSLLYTPQGKPRVAIFSIAHLADAERMFFVSLLLNQTLGWMRAQSGTTSLRAMLYMDEVFGYLPPTANPPAKLPMLTLLKQARAFGLGVVLATQNPVDLDYKALSNAGTWFLGRLQTERDKMRVLEGLEGAAAGQGSFDRAAMESTLAALKSRIFLLHNVRQDGPQIFETRWALSYLRGPLTLPQIRTLRGVQPDPAEAPRHPTKATGSASAGSAMPVLPPGVPQVFQPASGEKVHYTPGLLGIAKVHFSDAKLGVEAVREVVRLLPLGEGDMSIDWGNAEPAELRADDLTRAPAEGATFASIPSLAAQPKSYAAWTKSFTEAVYREARCDLFKSTLGALSRPGESEAEFRNRLVQRGREERDRQVDAMRLQYATQLQNLDQRLARAEQRIAQQKEEASHQKLQTAISFGATLLGAVLGRRRLGATTLGRAATAARGVGRVMKEGGDVDRAEDSFEALLQQKAALQAEIEAAARRIGSATDVLNEQFQKLSLKPKKSDIEVRLVALAWSPK